MRRAVVDLNSSRPVWQAPATTIRAIRAAFGDGWKVRKVRSVASSDGDGGAGSDEAVRAARGAEIYMGWGVPASVVTAGQATLEWVHTASAGVGSCLTPELCNSGAIFTNSRGIQSEPMADWVLAAIGFCLRGFHAAVAAQRERRWAKEVFTDGNLSLREFAGTRVGIVGLGGVGRAVARRCVALGMSVRGIRRHSGRRVPRGVEWVGGMGDLIRLARTSDVLVVAAPHTAETQHMICDRVLRVVPRGAYVINVARGALLDEAAVVRNLDRGHMAGCVLDVFNREPLPKQHRFWRHPGVMVFPHVSAVSDRFWARWTALIVDNIDRYLGGRRLKNIVDLEAGY